VPTYEYECKKCGLVFDEYQSITAPPLTDCPSCKKKKSLKRLIGGGAGIIFKGTGFYETDYRSTSYKKGKDKEKEKKAPKSSGKKETKSESKKVK